MINSLLFCSFLIVSYIEMATLTKDIFNANFLQKRTWAGKNVVCSIFPQGVSEKIKDTKFYYDKCWGYILLLPLLNSSLSAKQILQYFFLNRNNFIQFMRFLSLTDHLNSVYKDSESPLSGLRRHKDYKDGQNLFLI